MQSMDQDDQTPGSDSADASAADPTPEPTAEPTAETADAADPTTVEPSAAADATVAEPPATLEPDVARDPDGAEPDAPPDASIRSSRTLAAFLSFLVPGTGQLLTGRLVAGLLFLSPVIVAVVAALIASGGDRGRLLGFLVQPSVLLAIVALDGRDLRLAGAGHPRCLVGPALAGAQDPAVRGHARPAPGADRVRRTSSSAPR